MKSGEGLIEQGIEDLANEAETIPALLVSIGEPRLRRSGVNIPDNTLESPEHRLYFLLQDIYADDAHSMYNWWIRELIRIERAIENGVLSANRESY